MNLDYLKPWYVHKIKSPKVLKFIKFCATILTIIAFLCVFVITPILKIYFPDRSWDFIKYIGCFLAIISAYCITNYISNKANRKTTDKKSNVSHKK